MFNKKKSYQKSPQEFFVESIGTLHTLAQNKKLANKGFILHEGLIEIGNPFIERGLNRSLISKKDHLISITL